MTSYATGSEFAQRYDVRLCGDLVSDTGTSVDSSSLPTNENLLAALADASASIDAAVFVGNRYTPAQMAALSTSAASFVRRLTCDLALIYLKRRRGKFNKENDGALLEEINATLDSLRAGEDLLLLASQTEAPASIMEIARPRLINKRRAQTIRRKTRNYYPANPDYDMPNDSGSGSRR